MQKEQECERVSAMLTDYAEDLLGEDEKRLVEEHVANCGDCRRELGEFMRMSALLKAARYEPPAGISENVALRINIYNRFAAKFYLYRCKENRIR